MMIEDAVAARIADIETDIEALAEAVERSRRIVLAARAGAAAAGLWLAAGMLGLVPLYAAQLVLAIAVIIGGIVFAGSSRSTIRETEAAIRRKEAQRDDLIDRIDPAVVTAREVSPRALPPH